MTIRNGYEDAFVGNSKCWNCGSPKYHQTTSREHCPACGIECNYWGGGANEKYKSAHARKNDAIEARVRRKVDEMFWDD